jgi:hypothetical protein
MVSSLLYEQSLSRLMTKEEILEAIRELADSEKFSEFSIDDLGKIFCNLYNQLQKMDINSIFGDEFLCMIQKIIEYFMSKEISREITILFSLIFTRISTKNYNMLLENVPDIITFIIHFIKWKKGGVMYVLKYHLIAMRISVLCPAFIPSFLEHLDIQKIKLIVSREDNNRETFFLIYNWIYHISSDTSGIVFILKEPEYFTKILCELIKNTNLQIFFHKAIVALENLLSLENPEIQKMARSELIGCVPNMTKVHFPPDLKEKWECVQKMF